MKRLHLFAAALVLGLPLPQAAVAQDGRITPVLSTTMQRICEGETTRAMLMERGEAIPDARPTLEKQTRGLRISALPGGLLFETTVSGPQGDALLRFELAPDGTVTGEAASGPAMDAYVAARPGADLPALVRALAEDTPERLLLGRSFAVGDAYYPENLRRSLVQRMAAGLNLPFAADGADDMAYLGETIHEGRRAWRFGGRITVGGAGDVTAGRVSVAQATEAAILHDAETGLILSYQTTSESRVDLDGQPFRHLRMTDTMTCDIVPQ
jgi:hypothetical protein